VTTVRIRHFTVFFDRYYWQTAILIARNGLARQYRNSFLGILWTLLQPASMTLIYTTMMPLIMRMSSRSGYVVYILVSLPVWNFFAASFIAASTSLLGNSDTLKRCTISSTIFPVADVLRNLYTFTIAFGIAYGFCLLLGLTPLDFFILLIPLYLVPIVISVLSIAIAIAFVAPFVRDIGELIVSLLTVAFWLTPIVYSISALPDRAQGYLFWNPFFIMLRPMDG
jgi:homopolymeric O-antigen transport system permease protein